MHLCGSGIWFANGKFGVTWRLFQAVVKPRASLKGKCHISLDPVEKDKLEKEEDDVPAEAVDDSDVEPDVDDDDVVKSVDAKPVENTVTPSADEPPTKKKRVVKKKTT